MARRLLPLILIVMGDDDYRADGPMTIPYDPITGEPISTVRPGWSCSNPCPTDFTNYFGPCCLNSAGEARWNLDNYCEDSLKFHTYFDSDMKFNYECEAAVDRYGCGPPVDDLSGWMWQYDLRVECCATCQPDQTRRPTKLPTPKPTMWPIAENITIVYDDDVEEETTDEFQQGVGFATATAGGSVGGVPVAAILGIVLVLLAAVIGDKLHRRHVMRKFRQAQLANSDDAAARVGDGTPPPRTDLTLRQRWMRCLWSIIQHVAWSFGLVVTKPIDRIDYLRGKFGGRRVDEAFDELGIDDPYERVKWQDKWLEIDNDESMAVDRSEFTEYFALPNDTYGKRCWHMFRNKGSNNCGFVEFLRSCAECCLCDRLSSEKFAFRLLSRYCDDKPEKFLRKRCLDVADLEAFLLHRSYDGTKQDSDYVAAQKKRAIKIGLYVDADASGGISFEEFRNFCEKSLVFVALGHKYQTALRRRVFGDRYWFDLTRRLRLRREPPPTPWYRRIFSKRTTKVAPAGGPAAADALSRPPQPGGPAAADAIRAPAPVGGAPTAPDAIRAPRRLAPLGGPTAPERVSSRRLSHISEVTDEGSEEHSVKSPKRVAFADGVPPASPAARASSPTRPRSPKRVAFTEAPVSPLTVQSDDAPPPLPPGARPTSPKRVLFTDDVHRARRPPSLNIRPSWGSESEVSSVSSSSAYSANLSPLSDGSQRNFPILKPKPRLGIRKWMKRQIYGMEPEERWQEQIEDYCAIHYPDPLPFADWCPLFREDFGFVYEQLKKADEQRRAVSQASDDLRGVMDENLCRRLIETCETLCHDPHTLDGAFHKWKGRTLRRTWDERPVHADVQARINAKASSLEVMADHHALHRRKHELHRPNPAFKDDLAPLPDLQRSRRRPRTAPVGLREKRRPSSARGLRPYAYEASSSSPNEAYRQTRRAPVHLPSLRGRCMHKLGSDVPDGHKIVVGSHGVGRPTSSGRGALSNIGSSRRPRTAPSRPVLY